MEVPRLVVLNVIGTLMDLGSLRPRLVRAGGSAGDLERVLAETLRDAFAVATTGEVRSFPVLLEGGLRTVVPDADDEAVAQFVAGLTELAVYPDVVPGLRALADAGVPLLALSNGGSAPTTALLERNGLSDVVPTVVGVDDAGVGKPAREPYLLACHTGGVEFGDALMVASHPWDLHGARKVGMRTAWIDRSGAPWPSVFQPPDVHVGSVLGLPGALGLPPAD